MKGLLVFIPISLWEGG